MGLPVQRNAPILVDQLWSQPCLLIQPVDIGGGGIKTLRPQEVAVPRAAQAHRRDVLPQFRVCFLGGKGEVAGSPLRINSKERIEYCIKEFIKKKVLPKAADIRYIATHEWGHFVSVGQLRDSKSKVITIFRRSNPKDFVSENAAINVHEYAADCIACRLLGIPCKNADKIVELLLK